MQANKQSKKQISTWTKKAKHMLARLIKAELINHNDIQFETRCQRQASRECLCPEGWTTRKHNASSPIYKMGGGMKKRGQTGTKLLLYVSLCHGCS